MSFYPKISLNYKQLKIKNNQTEQKIDALMKEKETVIRCLKNEEIRFRNKYEKYYFRKGFDDLQKRRFVLLNNHPSQNDKRQYASSLHTLIFSKGEIDIEKVLCLHLLTVYDVRTDQEISSLQNLLKHTGIKKQPNKILPTYIAEFYYKSRVVWPETTSEKVCVIINSYIESLVEVILDVLQEINRCKFNQIVQLSKNIFALDELMQKQKILSLVDKLKENPLVMDIINFRTEMRKVASMNTYNDSDDISTVRIKIKDSHYKFHLIKQEIRSSLRKRIQSQKICGLGSTLSLLQRKLKTEKNINFDNSIITLTNRFIDLSSLSTLSSEEITLFASIDSMLSNSKPSIHIRKSLYSNYSIPTQYAPVNAYSLKIKKGPFIIESESERIMQSILQKLSYAQRIMVGKRAAQLKSNDIIQGSASGHKTPIASLIADVLSTESLISLACSSCNEELELIMAPCCKGGLGIGTHIPDHKHESYSTTIYPPGQNDSKTTEMDMKSIKQDLLTYELKSKVASFVRSENP